jgi:hypothetical protein
LNYYIWYTPLVKINIGTHFQLLILIKMKKALLTYIFLLSYIISIGQDFTLIEDYTIYESDYELDSLFWTIPPEERQPIKAFLTPTSDTTNHIQEFTILELETYDGNRIYSLKDPKLSNVKEIIQVQFEYFACCVSVENHYFIVTYDNEWIKLPVVNYVACDGPEPFEEYRFPNQKFGIENTILKTNSFPDSNYNIDSVKVIENYTWNGKEIIKN